MPTAIQTALPDIAFSKNPLWLKLLSDDFLAAAPATAINYVEFPAVVAVDSVIAITWTGATATMTAKAVANDTGLQFPAGDGSLPYVQNLIPFFEGNYFLDKFFTISAVNGPAHPRLVFTARAKGPEYNFGAGANIGIITVGSTDAIKPNFRHHVQLWIGLPASADYELAYTANIPLDVPGAGLTSNDIHEHLHAWLNPDLPELIDMARSCYNSIRAYFVKFAQFYGVDPTVQRLYKTGNYLITKGGLGMRAATEMNIRNYQCPDPYDRSTWRFLRQGSKNKLIRKEQPEWLTYINLAGVVLNVRLEIKIYNSDVTTFTFYTTAPFEMEPGTKCQFQCGYTQLGIAGRQGVGTVPSYYTARLKGDAGYLSAEYAFVIDNNFQEWPRYFVYENSLGAYQTIYTTGKGQSEFDLDKEDAQLAVDRGKAAIAGEFLETNITWQDRYTVNYGYANSGARNIALLRDFFASRSRFIYDRGKLTPIGISTKNSKDAPDGVDPYAPSFEYYPLYTEEVFTEDVDLADLSIPELLDDAGSPVIEPTPVPGDDDDLIAGIIVVEYGDAHLSVVADRQKYTAPYWLLGRSGYRIYATQRAGYFRTEDIIYNAEGSFIVAEDGFRLQLGDQLLISPFVLNPDS